MEKANEAAVDLLRKWIDEDRQRIYREAKAEGLEEAAGVVESSALAERINLMHPAQAWGWLDKTKVLGALRARAAAAREGK